MKPSPRLYFKLLVLALGLSACRIVVDTHLNSDGSGQLQNAVVYSAEEARGFAQTPGNESKSICDNLQQNLASEAAITEEVVGDETYCITTRSFTDLTELRQLYSQMGQVTVQQLKLDLGQVVFEVDVAITSTANSPGIAQQWRLTLPGEVGLHNADRVEGQTLIWDIAPEEQAHLYAEGKVGLSLRSLGPTGAVILVCVASLALLGGVGAFYLVRRQSRMA